MARTTEARAEAAKIEDEYKAERSRLEAVYNDTTGDVDARMLESRKAQRFKGSCHAEWVMYDADSKMLTLAVAGADRMFEMPIADAQQFKPRSSRLTCEGGFTARKRCP